MEMYVSKNRKGKKSTVKEDTNESTANSYAKVKSLSYGVEENANWQPYLKRVTILSTSKIYRECFD